MQDLAAYNETDVGVFRLYSLICSISPVDYGLSIFKQIAMTSQYSMCNLQVRRSAGTETCTCPNNLMFCPRIVFYDMQNKLLVPPLLCLYSHETFGPPHSWLASWNPVIINAAKARHAVGDTETKKLREISNTNYHKIITITTVMQFISNVLIKH